MPLETKFFEELDKTQNFKERMNLIKSLLETIDLNQALSDSFSGMGKLTSKRNIPSDPRNNLSLPFAVGYKYLRDEPYEIRKKFPVYVLGITSKKELLVIDDKNDIFCIQRSWLEDPLYSNV